MAKQKRFAEEHSEFLRDAHHWRSSWPIHLLPDRDAANANETELESDDRSTLRGVFDTARSGWQAAGHRFILWLIRQYHTAC